MKPVVPSLGLAFAVLAAATAPLVAQIAPGIAIQPESLTLIEGEYIYFDVTATGSEPLSYQWRKNGSAISGATDAFYVKDPAVAADSGGYTVRISNSSGAVTSIVANLTVLIPPSVTTQPVGKTVITGSTVTFTAKGSGSAPLTYQWFKDNVPIDGATSTNLVFPSAQSSDSGDYTVAIANLACDYGAPSANSDVATLVVLVPPAITDEPDDAEINQGEVGLFSLLAEGTDTETCPLTYQWLFKGHYILGATDTLCELVAADPNDVGDYYCIVANNAGAVTSRTVYLTVNVPPAFDLNPASRTVWPGSNMIFYAHADGTQPIDYQWYFNDSPIDGATNTSYSVWIAGTAQRGKYNCVAGNVAGETWSYDAYLTVKAETVKPTVSFVNPVNGGRWSNAVATIIGAAADNAAIDHVEFRDNAVSGDYKTAMAISNSWTNWMAVFPAIPGTNRVDAVSEDDSANRSTIETMFFFYVVPSPFTLNTNGPGTASTNLGATLEIGKQYILTALPGAGSVFTNWTGGYTTNHPTIRFFMKTNLVLNMNFVDVQNPTVALTNSLPSGTLSSPQTTVGGTAADNWRIASVWYQLNSNAWTTAAGTSNWLASLTLVNGTNTLSVYSLDAAGRFSPTNGTSSVVTLNPPRPVVTAIERNDDTANVMFTTVSGLTYNLEYKNSLDDVGWTALAPTVSGNGGVRTLSDTSSPPAGRYYRVRGM